MHQLFLHEHAYQRMYETLSEYSDRIEIVRMDNESRLKDGKGNSFSGAVEPSAIYGTTDAFFSPCVADFMTACLKTPRLSWFQSSAAGIEHPVLQQIGAKAVSYTNSHAQSDAIAEWIMWGAMDWLQRGPDRRELQRKKVWQSLPWREVCETRWLIVGFGGIGQATGKRVKEIGGHVTGVRRSGGTSPFADEMIHPNKLIEHVPTADVVVLCTPLTDETRGMADAKFFAAMKSPALYVNVGRGGLNDEAALLNGLDAGLPDYALMDVFETEPLPEESPFWHHPRVTLTSHISAHTDAAKYRTDKIFLKNLELFLKGEPLVNAVPRSEFSV